MLDEVSSRELVEWHAFFSFEDWERKHGRPLPAYED